LSDGQAVREELGLRPEQPVIGTIAHFSPRKGHGYLLAAMAQLVKKFDDLCCLLIGEGKDEQHLRRAVGELGLEKHVRFLGYRHDAVELIKAMDVMVLPSLVEGLGIVLIEAGFLGKPAVASDIDGIDEVIVNGETGLLVPPADATALAVGIETLLDDAEWGRELGRQARLRMQRMFSLEAMTDRAEAVYHEVIAEYRRTHVVRTGR
jgi:glycosyltransferase involved in cell wall biosynthesis